MSLFGGIAEVTSEYFYDKKRYGQILTIYGHIE